MNKKLRILKWMICIVMLFTIMPIPTISAYYEKPTAEGNAELETMVYDYTQPVGVTMQRLSGNCVTEINNLGDDLLFVIKSGDRYYAMKDVAASEEAYEAIPAVDVTAWVNDDGSLSVPQDTSNVAFWRYEQRPEYEYGNFIKGQEKYLAYSYGYESVDGDDDYYNDAERNYWGEFKINFFEDGGYIESDPYYWSENGTSGTLKFNGTWSYKISSYNYQYLKYNLIADLRSDGNGGQEFYFRYLGSDVDYVGDEVEGYMYYADCRHQHTIRHAEYDAPTCMLKGCEEYWYCEGCDEYFKDEAMTQLWGDSMPIISATGHDWGSEKCNNCEREIPVYSKVTNQEDFNALAEDTMFVLVSEYNGKYYVPDLSEIYLYMMDTDGDGYYDIHNIDENGNDVPDYLEFDDDEDGQYDYLTWDMDNDGIVDEKDHLEFHIMICNQYITDRLYSNDSVGAIEVTMNADGTFSHEAVKATTEFEMVDLYLENEINDMINYVKESEDWWTDDMRYTYECVKQFVIPNMFITAPSMAPMDRQYKQRIADAGDTYSWGVLFYNNANDYKVYNYETASIEQAKLKDLCKQDSVIVFDTFDHMWYDSTWNRQLGQLRLRDYNGTMTFVTGEDYMLEGVEYIDDPETGEGYYDTHDTQSCVYLYASQQPEHVCKFGDWVDNGDGRTHTHTCIDENCGKSETKSHTWDDGVESKAPKCEEAGETKYTCTGCKATKIEAIEQLGHDWGKWVYDSVDSHAHECNRNCGVTKEFEPHDWGKWISVDGSTHKMSCSICNGEQSGSHNFDEGVITKQPTEEEEGIKTFTCLTCEYTKTEPVAKVEHQHNWSNWVEKDENIHIHSCRCNETEVEDHNYDDGEVINWETHLYPGAMQYTCIDCGFTKIVERPVLEEHEWGRWIDNEDGTHTHTCECGEKETFDHTWSNWKEDGTSYRRVCEYCSAYETMVLDEEKPVNTTPNNLIANINMVNTDIELIDTVLTDEEQSQVASGATVSVYLKVEDISNSVPAAHIAEAEEKTTDEIGMYLDIDLFKKVGTANETQVTETDGKVTITITIPEELINTDTSVTRSYSIIRVHEEANGDLITDVIEGVYNPEDHTFTFETDKFSTYALAYRDTNVNKGPNTGDNSMMWIYAAMLFATYQMIHTYSKKKQL